MIGRWRNAVQLAAFLLLAAVPLLNLYASERAVTGWYQAMAVGGVDLVSPLEGLESILASGRLYGRLLLGLLPVVVISLLLGRVFCSWVCPVNALQEAADFATRPLLGTRRSPGRWLLPRRTLWLTLAADLVLVLAAGAPFFAFWSPPGLVGREIMMAVYYRTLAVEGGLVVLILLLNAATPRFFCRHLCPLGGLLAVLGAGRRLRVVRDEASCTLCGDCDKVCPLGITPSRGDSATIHCWNCGRCRDTCPHGSLRFRWGGRRR